MIVRGQTLDAALAAAEKNVEANAWVDCWRLGDDAGDLAEAWTPDQRSRHPHGAHGRFARTFRVKELAKRLPDQEGPSPWRPSGDFEPLHLGGTRTEAVTHELGKFADTRQKYSEIRDGKPVYTASRTRAHRRMIEELFAGHQPQPEGKRHAVFVAGGPASGKSSAEDYMPDVPDAVEIDQDYFKGKIAEYRHLAKKGDPYASDAAHAEAADIAHAARLEAMRRGYNVIVQGTGDSGKRQFSDKMVAAANQGYKVHGFYVSAPHDVAWERAQGRAKETGRAVPREPFDAMHANVSRRFFEDVNRPEVLSKLASLQLFDSREDTRKGGKVHKMAHLEGGKLKVDDAKLLDEFRDKTLSNPGRAVRGPSYI